ncbi:HD domain-containing protein [Deinococcus sp. SDU3-2]|uniref:HD domain-containing protein n=1 Tax=Deinococcus terrestris TaxID=2651870 RepID=A0A7X1TSX9_9DEIO|nr:HD domain-containing phosphohydrolase [Deinococcus terrestris]MPY67916.1 HD domain-containing protein [Deinococcus terrestris]
MPPDLDTLLREQPDPHHAQRVAHLACLTAPHLRLNPHHAFVAGLLHDLGKLGLPPGLLEAPRRLTPHELAHVRRHPRLGAQMTARLWPDCPPCVLHAIAYHHEREHGGGYPHGLSDLPPLTALIAACDVWDALTSERPYRPAIPPTEAQALLEQERLPITTVQGIGQDPEILVR